MASYAEYAARREEQLDKEIDEAAENQKEREQQEPENSFEMPEQFRGKSPEEIAKSYLEAQKVISRQGNELGEYRKAVDELLRSDAATNQPPSEEQEEEPIDIDRLYDDPEGTISQVVEKRSGDRIKKLEDELASARIQREVESLEETFPGWQSEVQTEDFVEWAQARPYLKRTLEAADNYDMDAARELLGLYYESKGKAKQDQRDEQLRQASLESASPEVPSEEEVFSRRELTQLRVRAKHGDPEAIEFWSKNANRVAIAYEEGRITN